MAKRLSVEEREELMRRREQLTLELRLLEAQLRSDEALRLQAERVGSGARRRLDMRPRWRDWVG
jgi:hypothetical protein